MSLIRSIAKFYAYPIFYVGKTLTGTVANLKAKLEKNAEAAAAKTGAKEAQGLGPAEKFQFYFEANAWTEDELTRQLTIVRATKRISKWATIFALLLCLYALGYCSVGPGAGRTPFAFALLMAFGCVVVTILGLGRTLYFGWWQHQLELRRIEPFGAYLGRPDFFTHLVG